MRERSFQAINSPSGEIINPASSVTYVNRTAVTYLSRAICYPSPRILPPTGFDQRPEHSIADSDRTRSAFRAFDR
jgi:hypothetical protein